MIEHIRAWTTLRIERFYADQVAWAQSRQAGSLNGLKSYLTTVDYDCNLVTLAGWAAIIGGIAGNTISTKYSATSARIGIGSSSAAPVPAMIYLNSDTGAGSTTSYFQLVSGIPAITTGTSPATLTFTAQFGGTVANFNWNEFGIDNGTASGVTAQGLSLTLLNAGQSPQGTKPVGETWVATVVFNFGYPTQAGGVS